MSTLHNHLFFSTLRIKPFLCKSIRQQKKCGLQRKTLRRCLNLTCNYSSNRGIFGVPQCSLPNVFFLVSKKQVNKTPPTQTWEFCIKGTKILIL